MNEQRKLDFMESISGNGSGGNRVWMSSLFKILVASEDAIGKDIAEMNADEIGRALATNKVVSSTTLSNRFSFIARYKKWCMEQGYPAVIVKTGDMHVNMSHSIRSTMVYSPSQLDAIIKKAFQVTGERCSKYIYRAYLWLGFAGMYAEDAVKVRMSDINFRECTVMFNNRWYKFPECAADDIKHAGKMTHLERGNKVFRRCEGEAILRGRIRKNPISDAMYIQKTLNSAVTFYTGEAGFTGISFIRARKSGLFYEMLRREIAGVPVNFYQIGYDDYVHEGKMETCGQTKQKILRRMILNYERDYSAWKKAFEPELRQEFAIDSMPEAES